MRSIPIWAVAATSFVAGFGVADVTGVRPLGGLVLLAGGIWCARRTSAEVGTARAAGLAGFAFVGFVVSHVLADALGTWGAVFTIAAAVAALTYLLVDGPAGRRPLPA